jgi:hypothetical protein
MRDGVETSVSDRRHFHVHAELGMHMIGQKTPEMGGGADLAATPQHGHNPRRWS